MVEAPDSRWTDEPPSYAPGETQEDSQRIRRPVMPARPQSQPRSSSPWRRFLSLLSALFGLGIVCVILVVCSFGNLAALVVAGGIFAFGAVHYLIWGWWLSKSIRDQVAEEDRQTGTT